MIKVILADDHELVRYGLKMVLEADPEIKLISEATDGQETLELIEEEEPDVLIVDIRMPLMTGLEVTQKVKKTHPRMKVLVLTMHDDSEYILKAVEYGADGYVLKDTNKQEFIKAVHMVYNGQKYFSGDISTTLVNSLSATTRSTDVSHKPEAANGYQLTKRESEILQMIYDGVSNKDIAEKLGKSVRTIETHRFNIMKKLEVSNITELLRKIDREGILS